MGDCAQELPEGVIARVGDRTIDVAAFSEAVEKIKKQDLASGLDYAAKRGLLDALLARELPTLEDMRRQLDSEADIQRQMADLQRQ